MEPSLLQSSSAWNPTRRTLWQLARRKTRKGLIGKFQSSERAVLDLDEIQGYILLVSLMENSRHCDDPLLPGHCVAITYFVDRQRPPSTMQCMSRKVQGLGKQLELPRYRVMKSLSVKICRTRELLRVLLLRLKLRHELLAEVPFLKTLETAQATRSWNKLVDNIPDVIGLMQALAVLDLITMTLKDRFLLAALAPHPGKVNDCLRSDLVLSVMWLPAKLSENIPVLCRIECEPGFLHPDEP
ncbi:hypothetical protein SELMODRAFT_424777 [Selaginella moellendorffii]|uniref:Uncharacterized protein n=1 Tax=Selaginella moellendorffii TaxID=88036 RepID=D8SRL4_SELML|nr:hypothetical protein SELMODRAFT_424777 [Selaginella moellendorffii]